MTHVSIGEDEGQSFRYNATQDKVGVAWQIGKTAVRQGAGAEAVTAVL
jgi:hypothetical protein